MVEEHYLRDEYTWFLLLHRVGHVNNIQHH